MNTSDIGLFQLGDGSFRVDLKIANNDLATDAGLETACYISLFTDRLVDQDEVPYGETSRRGWWGDLFANVDGDLIGSRLWLLDRSKQIVDTLNQAEDYASEALQWLVDDGIASSFNVDAEFNSSGYMIITVLIYMPTGQKTFKFSTLWAAEAAKG
jgi:phage gp46-like protein